MLSTKSYEEGRTKRRMSSCTNSTSNFRSLARALAFCSRNAVASTKESRYGKSSLGQDRGMSAGAAAQIEDMCPAELH